MKAVVFHDIGDIRLEEVPDPQIQEPTDAVIRLTASAICGTDLHFVRGTMAPVNEGTILGHEGVGIVEEVGADVRNLQVGDRVVVGSTIGCGNCSYCRAGYYAQCDRANPNGHDAGTAFFGGPANRPLRRTPGRASADPVRERDARQAAGHGLRRPGHPHLRHLPHGLLRGAHGRHQAGAHRVRVGLRAGGHLRGDRRPALRRRPHLRRRQASRPARDGPPPGRRDHRLLAGGPGRDAQAAHRRHRAGLGHRRGRRRVRAPTLRARRRGSRPARRAVPGGDRRDGARPGLERRAVAAGRRAVAALGRRGPGQGPARSRSSASIHRPSTPSPSVRP
jgi:hypothetical protein